MNPLLKGGIAFGAIAGVGGASYGAYNAMQTTPTVTPEKQKITTYAETLKDTLLPTSGNDHDTHWKDRLDSLQKIDSIDKLVVGLKGLKTKSGNDQWKTLRTWCQNTITNTSKGNQDQEFKNIQSYCTFSVKEKLGEKVIVDGAADSDGKWTKAHENLKNIPNLNPTLIAAKDASDGTGKTKVKDWCMPKYSESFKGETDPDFVLAKQVCVSA